MKFTPGPIITLIASSVLMLCAAQAFSARPSSVTTFDATFRSYQELSSDPRGTREQWLRVVRSFVAIHHKAKTSVTGRRGLFFAGRACLSLYRRSGNKADLDMAIRHLSAFVRMHRSGPYLILGLQELKEAHLLKRRLATTRHRQSPRQSVQRATKGSACRSVAVTSTTRSQEAPPHVQRTAPVGLAQPEIPGPPARSIAGQVPVGAAVPGIPPVSTVPDHAPTTCSEFNCTGNPFFQGPRPYTRKALQAVRSASLPPATMTDAPRALKPEPVETPPSVAVPQELPRSSVQTEALKGKAPANDAVDPASHDDAAALSCNPGPNKWVVVIDPGHGGKDPGATSNDGQLKEKDVVLKVAKEIKAHLEKHYPGITVSLTRSDDSFLPLQERIAFANSLNADLFVSVHCNAAEDSSSRGIETYYLSKASSRKAMASAARENGIPADRMNDIDATLLDLLMDSKNSESVKLAETVHQSLIRTVVGTNSPRRNRGVKRAPFYVLLGAKMPAILVECGFINGRERESLKERNYLDSLAVGITDGIGHYLQGLGDKG